MKMTSAMIDSVHNGSNDYEAGRRLLPHFIDDLAVQDPDRIVARLPKGLRVQDGFQSVTTAQFANAINKAASWFVDVFGKAPESNKMLTYSYVGPHDFRYPILTIGAIKAGYLLFLPSLRNSQAAYESLMDQYECDTLLLPAEPIWRARLRKVIAAKSLRVIEVPELNELLHAEGVQPVEWPMTLEQGRFMPLVALHTSGTTGIPKKVVMTHATFTSIDAQKRLTKPLWHEIYSGGKALMLYPFFHAGGFIAMLTPLAFGCPIILHPPGPPPNAQTIAEIIETEHPTITNITPSPIVDMMNDPQLAPVLDKLTHILSGSGPMPSTVGARVAKQTQFHMLYGSTEIGMPPADLSDPEDWDYMRFQEHSGVEMRPYAEDLVELFIVRRPELDAYQPVFTMFPHLQEYQSRDLFSKHPTQEGLYRFAGRSDDIVAYSTGEKFNPSTVESSLLGHLELKGAIVVGDGRFQSALLVEPSSSSVSEEDIIDSIWPLVETLNKDCPGYAKIMRNMIIVAKPDRPLPRSGKGVVQRRAALSLYAADINAVYNAVDQDQADSSDAPGVASDNDGDLESALLAIARSTDSFGDVSLDSDLFELGLDSLGVLALVRAAKKLSARHKLERVLTATDVYQLRNLRNLAEKLRGKEKDQRPATEKMQELYEQLIADMAMTARPAASMPLQKVMLLTRSTGSLGSYLLNKLLQNPNISRVVCLGRSADAETRQHRSMAEKGLITDFGVGKVQFLHAQLSKPYLGLPLEVYRELLENVTHVVHNAWQVNFLASWEEMTPQVHSVRGLTDFSTQSRHGARIFFVSTIGAVGALRTIKGVEVPEQIVEDWSAGGNMGYGQSKLVAERLLVAAAKEAMVPSIICRVGQVAGPTISKDWVPVDVMARSMVELCLHTSPSKDGPAVYHTVNAHKADWADLVPFLEKRLELRTVSLQEWVRLLLASDVSDATHNPAARLGDFFQNIANQNADESALSVLSSVSARKISPTLASLKAIDVELMDLWLRQWGLVT
ncbi:hypothetical protein CERZMDRAFT_103567 [Cercospora zeae-maydis SCOH1-5]|uniref:Carrier domain-containing protein n=1 Tax=Cercospora zeae-maydis SCOH1-5 TaxID=717836 RepID=A0A6A6EZA9_9PEZI|nr:hypothetical protein CERZMDRAFT_103567 [Cercospora zeae-maydis SCOH1-5]